MSRIRATIIGVTGRMGQALLRCAVEFPGIEITAAVASSRSASLGRDAGDASGVLSGVRVTDDLDAALTQADVALDFSHAQATAAHLAACRSAGKPLLIGTTGFDCDLTEAQLDGAARSIPLLVAPNTSLGVALLTELVRTAARALPLQFDVEIIEAHHRMKKDAPSGTALALARSAAEGRGLAPAEALAAAGSNRTGPRRPAEIGFAVVRGGDIVGEHEVWFAGPGERLTLGHRASDRAIFARGALTAALWLARQPAGRYSMRDILFSNQ